MQYSPDTQKIDIKALKENPYYVKLNLATTEPTIYAFGQVGQDKQNNQVTAFITRNNLITVQVTVEVRDDADFMDTQFSDTMEKFNNYNKHLKFKHVEVKKLRDETKCNIEITYSKW